MSAQPASPLHLVQERPSGPGLSDYVLWQRANGCSENTIESRLNHLAEFARSHPSFPAVSPMHITAWLGRPGYAPASRATFFGHLRSYFTYAMENDLLAVDPMGRMRRPRVPKGKPRPLTAEQVHTVLTEAKNANMHAWLMLGLYAGLRAHEIAKIKAEDVDEVSILVVGKGGRTDQVPTHPLVWALAATMPSAGWWFPSRVEGGHVSSMTVSTLTTRLFKTNGIEGSIHRTRHTYATELLRAGSNVRVVQELLRHRSLDSTMIYTAVSEDEQADGIGRLQGRVSAAEEELALARFRRSATHCGQGHERTEGRCRTCRREDQARFLAKRAREAREAAGSEAAEDVHHELGTLDVLAGEFCDRGRADAEHVAVTSRSAALVEVRR
jgi:site-specific recombinase XerD